MPIKILSKGLPIAGFIKLGLSGGDRAGKQQPPVKLDHFEVTGTERDVNGVLLPDGALLERLVSAPEIRTCGGCARSAELAEKLDRPIFKTRGLPIELPVVLPYDDLALNLQHQLTWFRGSAAFCRGDGETAERRSLKRDPKDGSETFGAFAPHSPCAMGGCPDFAEDEKGNRRCKPHARLRVMIGVQQMVGQAYEFRTTSWNSIRNLQESLEQIQSVSAGVLQYVPMYLETVAQRIARPGGRTTTHQVVKISFRGSPQALLETVTNMLELRAPMLERVRRLEASISREWTFSPEDVREIRAEFTPEDAAEDEPAGETGSGVELVTPAQAPEPLPAEIAGYGCRHPGNPRQEGEDWVCELCGVVLDPSGPDPGAADASAKIGQEELSQLWAEIRVRAAALHGAATAENSKALLLAVLKKSGVEKSGDITVGQFPEILALAQVIEP